MTLLLPPDRLSFHLRRVALWVLRISTGHALLLAAALVAFYGHSHALVSSSEPVLLTGLPICPYYQALMEPLLLVWWGSLALAPLAMALSLMLNWHKPRTGRYLRCLLAQAAALLTMGSGLYNWYVA